MMHGVNDVVHERLRVAPLRDGEFAKYRLTMADKEDITRTEESSGKKMKHQQVYAFVGRKRIYDPFQKKKVLIQNVTSFKPEKLPDGQIKEVPIVGRVTFPSSGELIVTDRDNDLYAYLERMDENASNEYRDAKKFPKPVFYRVDVKKQVMRELEKDYIMVDALNWVRDANEVELKTIYKALDDGSRKDINADSMEQMKKGIFNLAKNNPILVLKSSTNRTAKLKVQCMEAETYRVIAFSEENGQRSWVWVSGEPIVICTVEPGIHKIDALVKFFSSTEKNKDGELIGKAWYTKVIEGLKNVLEFKR